MACEVEPLDGFFIGVLYEYQVGSGKNQQVVVSVDHVFMHVEGSESSGEVREPSNKDLMATIENLQHSQASMWEMLQSLCQRTATQRER